MELKPFIATVILVAAAMIVIGWLVPATRKWLWLDILPPPF